MSAMSTHSCVRPPRAATTWGLMRPMQNFPPLSSPQHLICRLSELPNTKLIPEGYQIPNCPEGYQIPNCPEGYQIPNCCAKSQSPIFYWWWPRRPILGAPAP